MSIATPPTTTKENCGNEVRKTVGGNTDDLFSDDDIEDGFVVDEKPILIPVQFDHEYQSPSPEESARQERESKLRKAKITKQTQYTDTEYEATVAEHLSAMRAHHAKDRAEEIWHHNRDFEVEVNKQILYQSARTKAREVLAGGSAEDAIAKLPTPETLDDMVAARGDGALYRFDGLTLVEGNTLVCGSNKAGKTERTLEIVRSLLTGEDLFGEFEVSTPLEGDVLYVNYELSKDQFANWLETLGIPSGRIKYLNLRGYNNVPLTTDVGAEWLLSHCGNVETLVLDPAARMIQAAGITDENSNDGIKPLCGRLDEIKKQGGIRDLIIPIHANQWVYPLRPRGADYWGSWMDSQITIEKSFDTKAKKHRWFVSAFGRDIDVPRSQLHRDDSTHLCRVDTPTTVEVDPNNPLSVSIGEKRGPGRPGKSVDWLRTATFDYLDMHPDASQRKTYEEVGGTKSVVTEAYKEWHKDRENQ